MYFLVHFLAMASMTVLNRLLQIGGADARNLAEIKRRHGPKYTSMYILGLRVCNANSLLHRTTAVHGGIELKLAINAPKDGRGISQKQVLEQNLSSTDVHGRTSVERYTDVQLLNSLFQKAYGKFFQNRRVNTSDRIDKNRRIIVANG